MAIRPTILNRIPAPHKRPAHSQTSEVSKTSEVSFFLHKRPVFWTHDSGLMTPDSLSTVRKRCSSSLRMIAVAPHTLWP